MKEKAWKKSNVFAVFQNAITAMLKITRHLAVYVLRLQRHSLLLQLLRHLKVAVPEVALADLMEVVLEGSAEVVLEEVVSVVGVPVAVVLDEAGKIMVIRRVNNDGRPKATAFTR